MDMGGVLLEHSTPQAANPASDLAHSLTKQDKKLYQLGW